MSDTKYYDGTKLLSLKDISGNRPNVYMVTSNRAAGKTTYWNRYLFNRFIKHGEKFALLFRYKDQLDDLAGKYFKDIGPLFFPEWTVKAEKKSKGDYIELYCCKIQDCEDPEAWVSCGYGLALNTANKYKNASHYFSDVKRMYFDEFQAEFHGYCPNELEKLENIHSTIARGQGEQSRYVPIIMSGNTVSVINPYFIAFGITNRIDSKTKFLRGDGFVLECNFNESASEALKANTIFSGKYSAYQSEGVYSLDNTAFITKMNGNSKYLYTLKMHGNSYGIRLYENGIIYVNKKADLTYCNTIAGDIESHDLSTIITNDRITKQNLLNYFNQGKMRFYDLECKNDMLEYLTSYYNYV